MQEVENGLNTIQKPWIMDKQLDMVVILGPTASGKTKLAVALAHAIQGEIISADSRQVYRQMDIGTGKDLSEYTIDGQQIPYHLIDIYEPGEKYHVYQFQQDFQQAYQSIRDKGKMPILCGGTGLYIESVLLDRTLTSVPVNIPLRQELEEYTDSALHQLFESFSSAYDSVADISTRKRLIRAIEIKQWLRENPTQVNSLHANSSLHYRVFGINPPVEIRRNRISSRLQDRVASGMIEEVEQLLAAGLSAEDLIYYGLEYKYITLYLTGELTKQAMLTKLETEIHRYAKRQMTYFRHMEKIGISIRWLDGTVDTSENLKILLQEISVEKF